MTRAALVLFALVSGLACLPDPAPIQWAPVDIEALREQLANPSGEVSEATTDEVAARFVRRREAHRAIGNYIHGVFAGEGEGASARFVTPRALSGTSVYALVACPGPDLRAADVGFAYGAIRLDSPTLTEELIASRSFGGDLLLSFSGCQIAGFTFDGSAPAHFDDDRLELAVDLNIDYRNEAAGIERSLSEPLLVGLAWTKILFTLESGDTLTIEWAPLELSLELVGANGSLTCEVVGAGLDCEPP
ncbi:hypothetical protein ENSA5_02600 [Enhygromyxa salina]|uniref:Lipoprotein n=1 Tax=Enhygromyxa salina TaxID=215803 RepID=A0A2S9YK14_9BACT|nr:hypothetical protein [Enhygromyxa salina]PRQ05439.1 hypothetical protein ENSA5_02600 [Enhygromyxa salina]